MGVKHGLSVSVNRVLRRISEPKIDEITGYWRKLHNERSFMICTPHKI